MILSDNQAYLCGYNSSALPVFYLAIVSHLIAVQTGSVVKAFCDGEGHAHKAALDDRPRHGGKSLANGHCGCTSRWAGLMTRGPVTLVLLPRIDKGAAQSDGEVCDDA